MTAPDGTITDWAAVTRHLDVLYAASEELETIFAGRKFTLDGHLVGSIGEVVAAYMFGLELMPASTLGHDALAPDGRRVEIKLTQGKSVPPAPCSRTSDRPASPQGRPCKCGV